MNEDAPSARRRPSAARYMARGLLWTIGGLVVAVPSQLLLFRLWVASLGTGPGVPGDGPNDLWIGMITFVPLLDLVVFAVVSCILVPILYVSHRDIHPGPIAVLPWVAGTTGLVAAIYAYTIGPGGPHLLLPLTAAPPTVFVAWAMTRMLVRANGDLRSLRRGRHILKR